MRKFVPALMIAVGAAVLVYATGADAQAVTTPATTSGTVTIEARPVVEALLPYILSAVGAVIVAVGGLAITVINKFGKRVGFEIDQQARDSLLASANNAAAGLIAKGAVKIEENGKITVPDNLLTQVAKEIVEKRAPDSIKQLDVKPEDVKNRIIEQVAKITAPVASTDTLAKT